MDTKAAEVAQTVACVVAVTAGAIPLVRVLLGGDVGLWLGWLPGTDQSPGSWTAPVVVLVVSLLAVLGLEHAKD